MAKTLKASVIGTGVISKEHLKFLQESSLAELVGVCDLSLAAGNYARQKYHALSAYTDYRKMLEEAKPDLVHILTPAHTHKFLAMDCLEAGVHVICEKPITPSYPQFRELWEVAKKNNLYLMEDHNYRFNTNIIAMQQLVKEGTLGNIQEVEVRMALDVRSGGPFADENLPHPIHQMPAGMVHDLITHICYLALLFIPDFKQVKSAWRNHGGGDLFKYDDLDALIINDSVHARLRFSSYTKPECFTVIVRGDRGFVETDIFQPYLRSVIPLQVGKQLTPLINHFVNGWQLMSASVSNFRDKIMQKTPYEGLYRLLELTYGAIIAGKELPISFEDMANTSRLIDALLAEENQI